MLIRIEGSGHSKDEKGEITEKHSVRYIPVHDPFEMNDA